MTKSSSIQFIAVRRESKVLKVFAQHRSQWMSAWYKRKSVCEMIFVFAAHPFGLPYRVYSLTVTALTRKDNDLHHRHHLTRPSSTIKVELPNVYTIYIPIYVYISFFFIISDFSLRLRLGSNFALYHR